MTWWKFWAAKPEPARSTTYWDNMERNANVRAPDPGMTPCHEGGGFPCDGWIVAGVCNVCGPVESSTPTEEPTP